MVQGTNSNWEVGATFYIESSILSVNRSRITQDLFSNIIYIFNISKEFYVLLICANSMSLHFYEECIFYLFARNWVKLVKICNALWPELGTCFYCSFLLIIFDLSMLDSIFMHGDTAIENCFIFLFLCFGKKSKFLNGAWEENGLTIWVQTWILWYFILLIEANDSFVFAFDVPYKNSSCSFVLNSWHITSHQWWVSCVEPLLFRKGFLY